MATIKDVLEGKGGQVFTIGPDDTVFTALKLMADKNIGALIVTEGERVVGILTERDYARKVILKGLASADTPVHKIMSGHVMYVTPSQSVEEGLALMTEKHIRHLPVMDGDALLGVVSIKDLAGSCIAKRDFLIDQLANYISGT